MLPREGGRVTCLYLGGDDKRLHESVAFDDMSKISLFNFKLAKYIFQYSEPPQIWKGFPSTAGYFGTKFWGSLKEAMTFLAEPIFRIGLLNLLSTEPTFRYREVWNFEARYSHEHNHMIRKHQIHYNFSPFCSILVSTSDLSFDIGLYYSL